MPQNPLNVQELREHCIGFLAGSPESLMSCALVARSWVNVAQANLFRAPLLVNWRILDDAPTATRFYDAVNSAPHLARYVRAIGIQLLPHQHRASSGSIAFNLSAPRPSLSYLRLDIMSVSGSRETPQKLQSTSLHPFDLDHVKSLEVPDSCSLIWDSIPPATRSAIEVLQLGIPGSTAVDLSTYPNLQLLRLRLPPAA
ncbi:hypothetical protein R3P38DRAFT_3218645 [Favolaschia claudopus]|uniref:F-box domain-containing protein n=1 Tax=Favolaschia claudopus TaxID=2862362 RepID=A0AAW0A4I3_9AGAR